jgi:DNA adenine methylase
MNFYSPLRYPGGKGKFSDFLAALIERNNLLDCVYIEPFCGGSAVGLSLLFEGYAKKIVLNDFDRVIYSFWDSVLNHTSDLIKMINNTEFNLSTWEKAKAIHKNHADFESLEVGFATFFLNRVNRSGILKAGLIGGKTQNGKWKMDARFNKSDLIKRIEKIASLKNRIEIMNLDALECIDSIKERNNFKPIIYFDPPYYHKGPELYLNYFNHSDHLRIAQYIERIEFSPWIVSYDNCPEIREIYSFANSTDYKLNYSAGNTRIKGSELLFASDRLQIPFEFLPDSVDLLVH